MGMDPCFDGIEEIEVFFEKRKAKGWAISTLTVHPFDL